MADCGTTYLSAALHGKCDKRLLYSFNSRENRKVFVL